MPTDLAITTPLLRSLRPPTHRPFAPMGMLVGTLTINIDSDLGGMDISFTDLNFTFVTCREYFVKSNLAPTDERNEVPRIRGVDVRSMTSTSILLSPPANVTFRVEVPKQLMDVLSATLTCTCLVVSILLLTLSCTRSYTAEEITLTLLPLSINAATDHSPSLTLIYPRDPEARLSLSLSLLLSLLSLVLMLELSLLPQSECTTFPVTSAQ